MMSRQIIFSDGCTHEAQLSSIRLTRTTNDEKPVLVNTDSFLSPAEAFNPLLLK